VTVVTENLLLRGLLERKLSDRQVGPFKVEEQIGKHFFFFCAPGIWDWQGTRTGTLYMRRFASMSERRSSKQTSTRNLSCSRVGDARVSALRTIVREPYRTRNTLTD
jgi:hypothetical protein